MHMILKLMVWITWELIAVAVNDVASSFMKG